MSKEDKVPCMIAKVRATLDQYELVLRIIKQRLTQKLISTGTQIPDALYASSRQNLQAKRKFSRRFKREMVELAKSMKTSQDISWHRLAKVIGV